MSKTEKLTPA